MQQPSRIFWSLVVAAVAVLLAPGRAAAQSGTVTDDAFASSNATTQLLNLKGQGIALIVAGSSASVGSAPVGLTKSYIKFQLASSLPPNVAATNVQKATLKLFLSPSFSPTGAIDIYPVTSAWSESTLSASLQPTVAASPFASDVVIGTDMTYIVVDVTQLVQNWIEGPSSGGLANDGIALVAHTSSTYAVFDSKESIITSHEPRLEIVLANTGSQGPVGPQGPAGAAGPAGTAATITVGTTATGTPGTSALVTNAGSPSAALLNFVIPQGAPGTPGPQGAVGPVGATGATGAQGLQGPPGIPGAPGGTGPVGPAGINNRGAWNAANSYNVNDAVSDAGSFWLALVATSATATPPTSCEPSVAACAADWQLLAAQGAQGTQGQTGAQGQQGLQGPMGLIGAPGPPGPMPTGAALTTIPNTFNGNQTVNGSLILAGSGGVQFADGTLQTTASTASGDVPFGYMIVSTTPTAPPGFSVSGVFLGPNGNFWTSVAPMPTARSDLAVAAANGKIYAMGGVLFNGTSLVTLATLEVYNASTNTWSSAASMPTPRTDLGAAALNGKIYAIGGSGTAIVEVYDPSSNTWSTAAPMPTAKSGLAVATLNGKIYAIGGSGPDTEVYDSSTNTWSTAAPLPTPRGGLAAAALNGKIYAIGGTDGSGLPLNIMEVYDPSTNAWTSAVPMPTPRSGLAAVSVNENIYAIGGYGAAGTIGTVEVYIPSVNSGPGSWTTAASLPNFSFSLGAGTVFGFIYAIGGGNPKAGQFQYNQQYTPPTSLYTFVRNCTSGTQTACAGACVSLSTDNNNCGACGNVCPGGINGLVCSNSQCLTPSGGQCNTNNQCASALCQQDGTCQ